MPGNVVIQINHQNERLAGRQDPGTEQQLPKGRDIDS